MKWIKCSEQLPKDEELCLLSTGKQFYLGYYDKNYGWAIRSDTLDEQYVFSHSKISRWVALEDSL